MRSRLFLRDHKHPTPPLPVRAVAWCRGTKGFGWTVRSLFCRPTAAHRRRTAPTMMMMIMMMPAAAPVRPLRGASDGPLWPYRGGCRSAPNGLSRVATPACAGLGSLPCTGLPWPQLTRLPATPGQHVARGWRHCQLARLHSRSDSSLMEQSGSKIVDVRQACASLSVAEWPRTGATRLLI